MTDHCHWFKVAGPSLIVGPLCTAAGWVILFPTIGSGPTHAWLVSHGLLYVGWTAYVPAALGLHGVHQARAAWWTTAGTGVILLGVPLTLGQLSLDVVAAMHAANNGEMEYIFHRVLTTPQLALPLYRLGPPLTYVGLVLHVFALLRIGQLTRWQAACAMLGMVAIGLDQGRYGFRLAVLGHMLLAAAFVPLGRAYLRP